jgi:hypothetical protein
MKGYVYIIEAEDGFYKIGRSKNVPRRMSEFGVLLPSPVKPVYAFKMSDAPWAEKAMHQAFANQRANGEWFKLSHRHIILAPYIARVFQARLLVEDLGTEMMDERWENKSYVSEVEKNLELQLQQQPDRRAGLQLKAIRRWRRRVFSTAVCRRRLAKEAIRGAMFVPQVLGHRVLSDEEIEKILNDKFPL